MTKKPTKKEIHAQKVAAARDAQRRRGRCRQCERKPGINPITGKRYRMCTPHRKADCKRKKVGGDE
jgi:hypothetical protein